MFNFFTECVLNLTSSNLEANIKYVHWIKHHSITYEQNKDIYFDVRVGGNWMTRAICLRGLSAGVYKSLQMQITGL